MDDWSYEFAQHTSLLFGIFSNNGLNTADVKPWLFTEKDIVGFRAPYLSTSPGLWGALAKAGFRYDTSRTDSPDYWPAKTTQGFWNFPLATLKIAGSGKATLSMDYNFYMAQSAAKDDLADQGGI